MVKIWQFYLSLDFFGKVLAKKMLGTVKVAFWNLEKQNQTD
jgi:hypothetical protein